MSNTYRVLNRKPQADDLVLIHDEICYVAGFETSGDGYVSQVIVERQGETYSISPFETPIEVIELDS